MAFLDKNGLQTLTNKLVQGDAIKVASHRGHTVKNVIDNITRECENVATPNTMTLENRVSEFKVGKGRDVDVSGDVEEGKIEVELQGKTYQNLCGSNASVSIQYMDDYKIEDTEEYLKITRNAENYTGWFYFSNRTLKVNMLKPNTTYTVFFKYESINSNTPRLQFMQGNATQWLSDAFDSVRLKDNIYRCIIKTASSFESKEVGKQVIYFHNAQPKKIGDSVVLYKNMLLLEGDYSDLSVEELPKHFDGIKSSFDDGVVDVEVQGKNLFDGQLRIFNTNDTYIDNIGQHYNGDNNIPIKPNTSYTMTFETISGDSNIYIWNGNEKVLTIPGGKDTVSFRTPLECNSLSFYRNVADYTKDRLKYKIQLEENSKSTLYEPYYKKKISFNTGEPLRSLPNGVCDEIRNNNGKWELVRRTAKVILNGSENWDNSYSGWNNKVFCCPNNYLPNIKYAPANVSNVLSTLLPPTNIATLCSKLGYTGICTHAWDSSWLHVAKNEIETVEQLKSWLSQNPTTVYYELKTPIITPIEPMEFEVKHLATMTINSDIAPISNHKVVLNRAGQIEQGIIQIAELKKRVDSLETAYDSYLLETQHKLSILEFEYELESEEV